MFLRVVFIVMVVGLGWIINNVMDIMAYDRQLKFTDSCRFLPLPTPCEDLTFIDKHCAICGGGDIWNTFATGSRTAKPGAFWLVNTTAGTVREMPISGASAPQKLIIHGIYFSQATKRLYAVNHDEEPGESVEVFDLTDVGTLEHHLTVRSPLFGNLALNDVVEGSSNEFYVTEWQSFPIPVGGKAGTANASLSVKLQRAAIVPLNVLKIPLTRVFRCTMDGTPECTVASTYRFTMANGITISKDRQTVFVNDPVISSVIVFERLPDGSLEKVSQFKTKHMLDNIEMSFDGSLHGGSIPLPYTSGVTCEDAKELSATKIVDGREVGCGKSPGGLLKISLLGTGGKSFVDGTQVEMAVHDGSLLSGVSAALQFNKKVVMGGPYKPGLLLCDL